MRRKHIAFSFRALIALIVCLSLSAPLGAHAGGKGKKKQGLDGTQRVERGAEEVIRKTRGLMSARCVLLLCCEG